MNIQKNQLTMVRIDKKQQRRVTDKIVCHPSVTILNIYISDKVSEVLNPKKLRKLRNYHIRALLLN